LAMQAPLMGLVFLFIFTASTPDFTEALLIGIPFAVVYWLACIVAGLWLQIGAMLVFLKIARGQPTSMWEVFSGRRLLLSFVGASIVVGLIVLGGYCLLIVPGVIFALMYSQTLYLVVDRNLRIGEALTLSQQLTYGNKATLFVMAVIVGVAAAMVLQFTGILGALVVNPIMALLWAVTYLVMTGQPTADRLYGFGTSPFQPQGWQPQGWQPAARPAPPPG